MNKTFTINLNGSVYNINDDAYDVLHAYLENLKSHFANEEGAQEIMEDIESRIGELFSERMRYGMQVIRLSDVQDVISIMGAPEQIEEPASGRPEDPATETREEQRTDEGEATAGTSAADGSGKPRKRLFRDPDDKVIAGVCSGLGVYLNVDPWVIRGIFLLAFLFGFGASVLIYVIMWIIVPEAKTVAQKLQMRGEVPTVENIRNAINEGDLAATPAPERRSTVGEVLGFIVKFFAVIAGSCLGLVALMILMTVGLTTIPFFFNITDIPFFPNWGPMSSHYIHIQGNPLPMFIACLVAIVLPVYALIQLIMVRTKNAKPLSSAANWTLLAIWLAAMAVIGFTIF